MTTRPRSALGVGLVVAVCVIVGAAPPLAEVLPNGMKIELVLDNSAELGDIAQAPTGELWVLEKAGTVRVLVAGAELATLALTVTGDCDSGLLDVAFAPDYAKSGRAFVFYVDDTGTARVDEVFKRGPMLELGANILDLGTTPGGCRAGGGLDVGSDGKLYVAVGDLETPANGQEDGTLAGKVLRAELDGSVPGDNVSGTLVWAKGFRSTADLDVGSTGTAYVSDLGENHGAKDEVNAVHEGNNHGWDFVSGDSGGVYDDPLVYDSVTVGPEGLAMLEGDGLGSENQNTLLVTCSNEGENEIRQVVLTGDELDALEQVEVFYDAVGDADGTADDGCPSQFNALTEGGDGWLYGANTGANTGIWRIWKDMPGPREVSAPGSPFPLTVAKDGADILLAWEDLGPLDAGRPERNTGQNARTYQIYEGVLEDVALDAHVWIKGTNGTAAGPMRRTAPVTPGDGNYYYLVAAQGDNLHGSLGAATDGTPRAGEQDYCEGFYGKNLNQCAQEWYDPTNPSQVLKLTDYNPNSATYMQSLSLSDFRGKVIRMDLSADNCFYCNLQAPFVADVERDFHSRDFVAITVLTKTYSAADAIDPAQCAPIIAGWASRHDVDGPILCDTDLNGNTWGDVTQQWWWSSGCGGFPQNQYIDQGHTTWTRVCGGEGSYAAVANRIAGEVNPETCE